MTKIRKGKRTDIQYFKGFENLKNILYHFFWKSSIDAQSPVRYISTSTLHENMPLFPTYLFYKPKEFRNLTKRNSKLR